MFIDLICMKEVSDGGVLVFFFTWEAELLLPSVARVKLRVLSVSVDGALFAPVFVLFGGWGWGCLCPCLSFG